MPSYGSMIDPFFAGFNEATKTLSDARKTNASAKESEANALRLEAEAEIKKLEAKAKAFKQEGLMKEALKQAGEGRPELLETLREAYKYHPDPEAPEAPTTQDQIREGVTGPFSKTVESVGREPKPGPFGVTRERALGLGPIGELADEERRSVAMRPGESGVNYALRRNLGTINPGLWYAAAETAIEHPDRYATLSGKVAESQVKAPEGLARIRRDEAKGIETETLMPFRATELQARIAKHGRTGDGRGSDPKSKELSLQKKEIDLKIAQERLKNLQNPKPNAKKQSAQEKRIAELDKKIGEQLSKRQAAYSLIDSEDVTPEEVAEYRLKAKEAGALALSFQQEKNALKRELEATSGDPNQVTPSSQPSSGTNIPIVDRSGFLPSEDEIIARARSRRR